MKTTDVVPDFMEFTFEMLLSVFSLGKKEKWLINQTGVIGE